MDSDYLYSYCRQNREEIQKSSATNVVYNQPKQPTSGLQLFDTINLLMIFGRDEIKGGLKKTLNDNCRKVIEEQQLGLHLRLKYLHLYVYI